MLPIKIENIIGNLNIEINRASADKTSIKIRDVFLEFESFSQQLPAKSASEAKLHLELSEINNEMSSAVHKAHIQAPDSSHPITVQHVMEKQMRPRRQRLTLAYDQAVESYKTEIDILTNICSKLEEMINTSKRPQNEKDSFLYDLNLKRVQHKKMIDIKYSIDSSS